MQVPEKSQAYEETGKGMKIETEDGLGEFTTIDGDKILVRLWVTYPSYDFIFGVPDKSSPKFEKEVAFFQYRDTRKNKILQGMYIDVTELQDMVAGFTALLEVSKINSPHLWDLHNRNKNSQ